MVLFQNRWWTSSDSFCRKMDDFQFLQPVVTLVQISFIVDFFFSIHTCVWSAMHITLCKRTAWITVSFTFSFSLKLHFYILAFCLIRYHTYTSSVLNPTRTNLYKLKIQIRKTFSRRITDYLRAVGTIFHVFSTVANKFVTHWKCLKLI